MKRRTTVLKQKNVILEETELDEEPSTSAVMDPTPMVTALLRPRMLEQRAAYSRLSTRRDRLAFLRHEAVVGGAEAQLHGERLHVDRQVPLRRLNLRPETRPQAVMGIRPTDRRQDDVKVLAAVVPPGTVLLEPPPEDEDDYENDEDSSSSLFELTSAEEQYDEGRPPSRTLDNWSGLTTGTSPGGSASASDGRIASR